MPFLAFLTAASLCIDVVLLALLWTLGSPNDLSRFASIAMGPVLLGLGGGAFLVSMRRVPLLAGWLAGVAILFLLASTFFGILDRDDDPRSAWGWLQIVFGLIAIVGFRVAMGPGALAKLFADDSADWLKVEEIEGQVRFDIRQRRTTPLRNALIAVGVSAFLFLTLLSFLMARHQNTPAMGGMKIIGAIFLVVIAVVLLAAAVMVLITLAALSAPARRVLIVDREGIVLDKAPSGGVPARLAYASLTGPYCRWTGMQGFMPASTRPDSVTIGGGTGLPGMVAAGMVQAKAVTESVTDVSTIIGGQTVGFIFSGTSGQVYASYMGREVNLAKLLSPGEAQFIAEKISEAIAKVRLT